MKRICVFAGSSSGARPEYVGAAEELGRALVARGIGLVYGGARVVAKEVAHTGLPDLRVVSSMHERKALMADLADGFIALPGGFGTWEEFFEVVTWGQLGLHGRPCGVLNVRGYFDPLLALVGHSIAEGFVRPEYGSMIDRRAT